MSNYKTIIVSRLFHPIEGGVETFLLEVAKSWDIGNVDVFCKTEKSIPDTLSDPVNIYRFEMGNVSFLKSLLIWFKNFFRAKNKLIYLKFILFMFINRSISTTCARFADESKSKINKKETIIQTSMPIYTGVIGLFYKIMYNHKLVVYVHGSELIHHSRTFGQDLFQKFVFDKADLVISNSQYTTDLAISRGCPPHKIFKTLLGANIKRFFPKDTKSEILAKHKLANDTFLLLTVSHLVPRKGADKVLEALPKIIMEYPNVQYLIGGRGEYEQELRKLVRNFNLEKNVIFLGFLTDKEVEDYFNACDVFVMPNRMEDYDVEGFGIVFADAAACKKPTIAGNSGGAVDAIIDGKTGFLVNPLDSNDILEKITYYIENPEIAKKFGEAGYERVQTELNWNSVTQKIKERIREIE